ncbi:hypothetical protein [Bradyrhizobium sp. I71]|uniref:hypothetical protein n=1 Tax=Bradyrhizobium sp. I71 TaxID=2590772 RepID=UPI001EF8D39A|nr:hypothetical protein [Bradyrhizobium sp. I71]ULL00265.1 hypothetical protein FJV43_11195 [Bradyrhizobium sp. I71]
MRGFSQHRRNDHSHRSSALAQSEGEFPAKLAGHVVMPAESFIDAPADLKAPSAVKE